MRRIRWWAALTAMLVLAPVLAAPEETGPLPLPQVSFLVGPATECSLASVTPVIRTAAPIVLTEIRLTQPRDLPLPSFFSSIARNRPYLAYEFQPPETITDRSMAVVQAQGSYAYGLLLLPGQDWRDEAGLTVPVYTAGAWHGNAVIEYAAITPEEIAARAVINEDGLYRRAASYRDAVEAAVRGALVRVYCGTRYGNADDRLSFKRIRFPMQIQVHPHAGPWPGTAVDIARRAGQMPEWFADDAWIIRDGPGASLRMRADGEQRMSSVDPGFFTQVTPTMRFSELRIVADREAYRQRFPEAVFSNPPGRWYLRLPRTLNGKELADWSHLFDGTEFYLGIDGQGLCIMSNQARVPADPAMVRDKIDGLGLRDDRIAYTDSPEGWLSARRDRVIPELIAGLDRPEERVALGCLRLLSGAPASKELVDALARVAGNPAHQLSAGAVRVLVRYADNPRTQAVLAAAVTDAARFPDPLVRAQFALALGRYTEAADLLMPVMAQAEEYRLEPLINRLAAVDDPAVIPPLEAATRHGEWSVVSQALLALARVDPRGHALTPDQQVLLLNAGRRIKGDNDDIRQLAHPLSSLNREETRPLVLRMLVCRDARNWALHILSAWRDTAALPALSRLLASQPDYGTSYILTAYIEIDESDHTVADLLPLIGKTHAEPVIMLAQALARARIPDQRKLTMLQQTRQAAGDQAATQFAKALHGCGNNPALLGPLMDGETDIIVLGIHAARTRIDREQRYTTQLQRAVRLLGANLPALKLTKQFEEAMGQILDAAMLQNVREVDEPLEILLRSPDSAVRFAAAGLATQSPKWRARGLQLLYEQLGSNEQHQRKYAASVLTRVQPANETEREQRENFVLNHLGTPAEDYGLRLLATCGSARSVTALQPLLDEADIPRALYAAWVLAQLPDQQAARTGLRRLALYGLFNHYQAQAGEGISFRIADEVTFAQTISSFNRRPAASGLSIPSELLVPQNLSPAEQQFVVRAYRFKVRSQPITGGIEEMQRMDGGYAELLRVIASEDPDLLAIHVQDQPVAHFPNRMSAARVLARVTGKPATYRGLAGETLIMTEYPAAPYPEQLRLVAGHYAAVLRTALDYVPRQDSESDVNHRITARIDWLAREYFGKEMQEAFVAVRQP
jgi:hypothetical protein